MGESTFDKIKEYAALSEERREAYEAYLSYWDEGTLEDFEERYEGKYNGPKISPSTLARSAATLRTCRSGSNAALIIQPFGARSIRAEIIPRSMGTSSGIEQGQRKLLFAWLDFQKPSGFLQKFRMIFVIMQQKFTFSHFLQE